MKVNSTCFGVNARPSLVERPPFISAEASSPGSWKAAMLAKTFDCDHEQEHCCKRTRERPLRLAQPGNLAVEGQNPDSRTSGCPFETRTFGEGNEIRKACLYRNGDIEALKFGQNAAYSFGT
jgi:hypothetical protein